MVFKKLGRTGLEQQRHEMIQFGFLCLRSAKINDIEQVCCRCNVIAYMTICSNHKEKSKVKLGAAERERYVERNVIVETYVILNSIIPSIAVMIEEIVTPENQVKELSREENYEVDRIDYTSQG
jgi:hypothetical protein